MKAITFDKFDIGLDLRKGASVSDASRMRVLRNAYVTIGKVLRKRPGLQLIETFTGAETGTVGLVAGNGKLNTFIETVPAGHLNALFKMNRLAHPVSAEPVTSIDTGDIFDGYLYVCASYQSGDRYHHYLDTEEDQAYQSKPYEVGEYVKGNANSSWGLRQKVTTGTPLVNITNTTAVSNTVISAVGHTLVAGDIAYIRSCTTGVFAQTAINKIRIGVNAIVEATGHGYVAGDTVKISGVTDGEFVGEINDYHVISSVSANKFNIPLQCTTQANTGVIGETEINGDWVVLATPAPTANSFAIAQRCTTPATDGTVSVKSATEPAVWGSTVGATCQDSAARVTFTAESTYIADPACPHTKSFTTAASKVWAIDDDVVRGSSVSRPRIWDATLTTLPGVILPVSSHARGSSDTTAIAQYDGRLAVFFSDSVQFWDVDPNPALDQYYKTVDGVGCSFPQTCREFAGDVMFLASSGIRSVTTLQYGNQNLAESDVGSAIDDVVKPQVSSVIDPFSEFFTSMGQYWCVMKEIADQPVWAFTFSRTQKISAWAEYKFIQSDGAGGTTSLNITDAAVVGGHMYLRSGESVYKVDDTDTNFSDNGIDFEMMIEFPFLDFGKPGELKYIASMDVVFQGSCDVQFKFDPNNPALITDKIRLTGDTRQKASIPLEITSPSIAPVFSDTSDQDVQIEAITFYFENLGPISG